MGSIRMYLSSSLLFSSFLPSFKPATYTLSLPFSLSLSLSLSLSRFLFSASQASKSTIPVGAPFHTSSGRSTPGTDDKYQGVGNPISDKQRRGRGKEGLVAAEAMDERAHVVCSVCVSVCASVSEESFVSGSRQPNSSVTN